jgi:anaerobic selenocysteine-containing dehydrogenase
MVCVKGATIAESLDKNRLHYPMVRDSLDQEFRRVSWDEAFDLITKRIQTVRFTQGPEAICMYGSGQFQTEDYYTAQKLLKGCLEPIILMPTHAYACPVLWLGIFKVLVRMVPHAVMKTWS